MASRKKTADNTKERDAKLYDRFCDAIDVDQNLTEGEVCQAAIGVIASMVHNIHCSGCRAVLRKSLEELLARNLNHVMDDAATRDGDEPSPHPHVH